MLVITNQLFCYWLQGYFEIGINPTLNRQSVGLIENKLASIEEPLGIFTEWLQRVCNYIATKQYSEEICAYFTPVITRSLNSVFQHVIDDSYITTESKEALKLIHDGEKHD